MKLPITFQPDEKGYFDRECPNENCLYTFKVFMADWQEKISDDEVHCPRCGHIDSAEKWWTQKQLADMQNHAGNWAESYVQNELDKVFRDIEKSTKRNKYLKITYKPGRRISFANNPLGQSPEWDKEIQCSECHVKYSVIGAAYFCPCCGHNSIDQTFEDSLDSLEAMIGWLSELETSLSRSKGADVARAICQTMLENSLGDVVSAFQKFAEMNYRKISQKPVRPNDFQNVERGDQLFLEACGTGYRSWLVDGERSYMNLMFQRRHVLEHNGGLVDEQYIRKSGDISYDIGQRLVVTEEHTKLLIEIIRKLAAGLKTLTAVQ